MFRGSSSIGIENLILARGWTSCIVAASGPSLTEEVAQKCHGNKVIVVNDAWRIIPFADVLYACDSKWWNLKGCGSFAGERWSSHGGPKKNDKLETAKVHGLHLVHGKHGNGFSVKPGVIHYGSNSGFQAVNLAIQFGAKVIRLVGFDMRIVKGKRHFFGDHPQPFFNVQEEDLKTFIAAFNVAAKSLPVDIAIINCTPGSALHCFPMGEL